MNSTFSILTEIALAASDKLLIPITEDHMHRNGFEYLFALLYGFSQPSNVYYYYRHFSFYYRAKQHEVKLPRIHLILSKTNPASDNSDLNGKNHSSHDDMATECGRPASATNNEKLDRNEAQWMLIFELFKKHPQAFNLRKSLATVQIRTYIARY